LDPDTEHKPIERHKLSEQAREAIRERIISGQFSMGEKLTESGLVRLLGVSKSPIREALLQLEREGLIVLSANRTTRVFSMGAAEIAELGELRRILECEALRLAMGRNRAALARSLDAIVSQMEQALSQGDSGTYKLLDAEFHRAIFAQCGNGFVEANFRMLSFRIQALRNRLSLDPALNARSLQDHQQIRDAVAAGDDDRALRLLRNHVAATTETYLDRVGETATSRPAAPATMRIALPEMERFSRAALASVGAGEETVDAVTRALMHASTLGVDTHGFRLLPHYLRALAGGRVNPAPEPRIVGGKGGASVLDADDGHGALAAYRAAQIAVDRAREFGIGAVAIRKSSHFGAAGAYASEIARQGLMGLAFCNSDSIVRLHGGAEKFHGTNPIAVAAPAAQGPPWLLDMATSSIPFNRVLLNRSLGVPLPEAVASDGHGIDVTDPTVAEMLAPLGGMLFGYKGAGLAGVSEILSTALSEAPLSPELPPMMSDDMSTPRRLGAFVMALDPDAFAGGAVFRATVSRYLHAIRHSAVAAEQVVMAAGDREWNEAEVRRKTGLKLDGTTVAALKEFALDHGLSALQTLSAED
jgi:LDH2 family malate/lactate/ureidoglycolate dehydrogenase/DNA-binding GntR family transcriptional regulator